MTFFEELNKRLALPSPEFFKKIEAFGKWLKGVGLVLLSPVVSEIGVTLPFAIPAIVYKVGGVMAFVGYVIQKMAQLTVADPSSLNEPPVENK